MKICIGTITRNRPEMLRALLGSYGRMVLPANAEVMFAVVENNATITIEPVIAALRPVLAPAEIIVAAEPRAGIPFARNAVLDIALAQGADFLTFVDDDEQVDRDWLVNLLRKSEQQQYDLVGGPVLIRDMPDGATGLQKIIWKGLMQRDAYVAAKALKRFSRRGANSVNISTANWLGRLAFFRRTGLRFDDRIGAGSGSDRRLYKQLVSLGGKAGWTIDAPVYDTVPLSRLTLAYQFTRGRDHTAFLFADKSRADLPSRPVLALKALGRLPRILLSVLAIPFTGGTSIMMAARLAGDMVGFIDAFRGVHGSHYKNVTGQ
jgi:glycosyltransferase involved in cell wall biosynthesis